MVRYCSAFEPVGDEADQTGRPARRAAPRQSRQRTGRRAGRTSPGPGMSTSSRARNTYLAEDPPQRLGEAAAVYCVRGLGSGIAAVPGGRRGAAPASAKRWTKKAATKARDSDEHQQDQAAVGAVRGRDRHQRQPALAGPARAGRARVELAARHRRQVDRPAPGRRRSGSTRPRRDPIAARAESVDLVRAARRSLRGPAEEGDAVGAHEAGRGRAPPPAP